MSRSLLLRINRDKALAIKDAVDSWRADHADAMMARDCEEVVRECLRFPDEMRDLWRSIWTRAEQNRIENFQEEGEELQDLFDRLLKLVARVQRWASRIEANGYRVENAAALDETVRQVQAMKEQIFAHWPGIDGTRVEEALAEYRRGEHWSPEDLLHGLQDSHP